MVMCDVLCATARGATRDVMRRVGVLMEDGLLLELVVVKLLGQVLAGRGRGFA